MSVTSHNTENHPNLENLDSDNLHAHSASTVRWHLIGLIRVVGWHFRKQKRASLC